MGHTSIPHRGAQGGARRGTRLDAHGLSAWAREWLRRHSRAQGVLIRYSRRGTLHACMVNRTRPRAGIICGRCRKSIFSPRAHNRCVRDSECGCSRPDHPSAIRDVCAGRCSPVTAAVGRASEPPSIGCGLRGHGGTAQPRPWQAPLTVDAVTHVQGARCRPR
jgi:hypothetical protein